MTSSLLRPAALALCIVALLARPALADIKLIARGHIPGDATDRTGLTEILKDGIPNNRLGGLGGALAWTGKGNRYVLAPDRGTGDGTSSYRCRMHFYDITLVRDRLELQLVETVLLHDSTGEPFVSRDEEMANTKSGTPRRLDVEGIRAGRAGTFFTSDEYGPFIYEFDRQGKRLRSLKVPERFLITKPHPDPEVELKQNTKGRAPNRGMEGLAITPDGRKLYAMMQSPLLQDGGRKGTSARLLEIDLATQATREFLYPLSSEKNGVCEILAINEHQFLVLEREGKGLFSKLFKIDIAAASDISRLDTLPARGLPAGVTPVARSEFLNLLDPRYGLAKEDFMKKLEGLAFGPDLPDGRRLLLVSNDNDFSSTLATHILAFAIDPADLPGFRHQEFER
jgi:hypothetical protein